jgi:hypothetical protein
MNVDIPVAAGASGDCRAAIHGQGQDIAFVIISMVAEKFGASGCVGGKGIRREGSYCARNFNRGRSLSTSTIIFKRYYPTNRWTRRVAL